MRAEVVDVYPYSASSTVLKAAWVDEAPKVMVTWSTPHPEMTGRMLETIAAEWGCSQEAAAERLQPAVGILTVWVNGQAVWRDGRSTGARPGHALRRQQMKAAIA